ncbi:MAG: alpha/beta fold hydrolase [Bacteroidales bacterium]
MKKIALLFVALLGVVMCYAQLETREIMHDDTTRKYLEYLPDNYAGDEVFPVVVGLHGLGDNMNNFYNVGMNYIADTAGFILIIPEALEFDFLAYTMTAWNSGASLYGITPNTDVDDTGFLMAILDSLETHYTIDTSQVYFFGLSMGGYMCNKLACEKADRINAIASVSGTMGINYDPDPVHHIACLHIHGTNDETVAYTGNNSGMDADSLVNFWVAHNNNDTATIKYTYPDTVNDNLMFERYVYPNGDAQVAHIKVINGEHTWYYTPQNDIDYAREIWRFFKYRFQETEEAGSPSLFINKYSMYPNPASSHVNIDLHNSIIPEAIKLWNVNGEVIQTIYPYDTQIRLDVSNLPTGLYYLSTASDKSARRLVISR